MVVLVAIGLIENTRGDELICDCNSGVLFGIQSFCGIGSAPDRGLTGDLDFRLCPSTGATCSGSGLQTNCGNYTRITKTIPNSQEKIDGIRPRLIIVQSIKNTITFPLLVANVELQDGLKISEITNEIRNTRNQQAGVSDPLPQGVTIYKKSNCIPNARFEKTICPYEIQWKPPCSSSEDVQKYSCIDDTVAPSSLFCENRICRLLCTSPTMIVAMVHQPSFIHLDPIDTGTGKFLSNEWENVPYGVCRLIQDQRANACYKLKRTLHVGEELKFDLEAASLIAEDLLDVQVAVEPGMPNGMDFLINGVLGGQSTTARTSLTRTVVWVPRPSQAGKAGLPQMHIASFMAVILAEDFPKPCGEDMRMERKCASCPESYFRIHMQLEVAAYRNMWKRPIVTDPNVGKIVVGPRPVEDILAGTRSPDIVFFVPAGQQIQSLNLVCASDVVSSGSNAEKYFPIIRLENATIDGVLTEGHCDENSCSKASDLGGWQGFGKISKSTEDSPYTQKNAFEFKYKSVIGEDEGYEKRWCFSCGDTGDISPRAVQCITVRTRICELYVEQGNTLESIVRRYHLDRNWRRLWNLNSHITNPFRVLHGDQTLRYGAVYTVRAGDTMITIAAHFETTLKKLLSVNPHIQVESKILPGEDICILPCSDRKHAANPNNMANPFF